MADPFSIASGVAGIVSLGLEVVKGLYEYYSTLKDQSSDSARIHNSLSRLHDLLGNLRRQLDARRFRSDDNNILACIECRIHQCKGCIDELKKVADKFNHSQNDGFRAAVKAKLRHATYPFQQSTLQKLEENVDSVFQQVRFSLQLLQNEDANSIRNHVEDTKDLLELHRANDKAQDIIKWLNAPDATTNFNIAHEKSQPGTGAWLIHGQPFNAWLEQENSFLWLYGFAGCGKSILCSTAIQHILQHQNSSQDIGVAFFFFAFDDTGKQDASALLRALILQLSGQQGNILPSSHLSCLYDSCCNSTPRNQALLDCLHRLSRSFKHTYIIVDALDESPRDKHRQDVLDILTMIRGWMEPAIHLLATSRDEVDIRDSLDPSPSESLAVRNDACNKDIALYITQSLRNKPQLRKWKEFHGRIETTLTTQADGVFRWVDCQLREIAVCPRTEEHLDRLLTSLPQTLDDTYERMLLAIPPASQDYARQMLMLLCCAKRHLTVEELIYGMAVDLDSTGSNSDDTNPNDADSDHVDPNNLSLHSYRPVAVFKDKRKLQDADAVLEICPGFIELYRRRDASWDKKSYARIAHFSVQEYLKSCRIGKRENVAQYHMQGQDMNTQATRICLAILDKFDSESAAWENSYRFLKGEELFSQLAYELPWVHYAARFWPDHFRESKDIPPEAVIAMLQLRPRAFGISNASISTPGEPEPFSRYNPLQLATYYGLSSVVSGLLHDPATDMNEITGETTALLIAVTAGHMELARCFLDRDADIDAFDGGALLVAAATGQVKMTKLLLDHGAKVTDTAAKALYPAVERNRFEIAKLLLEHGADFRTCYARSEIHTAWRFNYEIEGFLGGHSIRIGRDVSGEKPLVLAAQKGNFEMVKLLLEHGVYGDGEALHAAAWKGDFEMVKLLLEHGVYGDGEALHAAAWEDDLAMGKLLLEHGADGDGEALHAAAWEGDFEMAIFLLKCGADPNLMKADKGRTALWSAVESKKLQLVRLLLKYGAEVNHCDYFGTTVLHKAAWIGHKDGVQLLLEHGAEVDIADKNGRTALFKAAKSSSEKVTELLLEEGADPNVLDKFGNTALFYAAESGCKDFFIFLLGFYAGGNDELLCGGKIGGRPHSI